MYGGSGMSPLGSAGSANWAGDGIDGQGITQGQNGGPGGPLTAALMAGGRRRRSRGQGRSRRQGRGQGMMGGTSQPMPYLNPGNPENLALGAAS
jgi:hypothetical protein